MVSVVCCRTGGTKLVHRGDRVNYVRASEPLNVGQRGQFTLYFDTIEDLVQWRRNTLFNLDVIQFNLNREELAIYKRKFRSQWLRPMPRIIGTNRNLTKPKGA